MTKIKIELDAEKSMGYGHLLKCCGRYQMVNIGELSSGDYWGCVICYTPLLINLAGQHYLIGQNVSI